ncbi:A24 family peptidase [Pseudoclavibacter sp. VKM Ac-2867]|uniref:prepilin peptidase n=1 Tax=Pseudoclavibacter sp. VKM Ac-2867 TaxID=2783829 RepID=UPI00188C371F|nr:A24 family peptidase [Pseudoclavibacter sp. VKM Ac-2867]MBF4459832.1 prepilin peptidase [Pseudoclavibacter sp. VKM Ac-2867]
MAERAQADPLTVMGPDPLRSASAAQGPAPRSRWSRVGEALCVGALLVVGVTSAFPQHPELLPASLAVAAVTPRLVAVDAREHRLPNRLVALGAIGVFFAWLADWALHGTPDLPALVTGASAGAVLFVLALTGGLGMGDVKLGAVLSWAAALVEPSLAALLGVLAILIGGVQSVIVLARTRDRRRSIAFGPALLAGYWIPAVWLAVPFG